MLLVQIFWDLGVGLERQNTFASIDIEEFDEDAEIQASMWNMLVRNKIDEEDLRDFRVTSASISEARNPLTASGHSRRLSSANRTRASYLENSDFTVI